MDQQNMDLQMFIDKLVSEKREFEGLAPDVIMQIKTDLLSRLEDRINMVIIKNMPEESIGEFEKLMDKGTNEEMQKFCAAHIPDLAQLIATELISFRQTYLG